MFLGLGAETSLTPNRSSKCNTDFTVILEFTMECVTQTIAKIKDKFQTALQCKINTNQIAEHGGKEREVVVGHRRLAEAEKVEEGRDVAVVAEEGEVEGELGLQILRALFIL
jgi:hypothetical protein